MNNYYTENHKIFDDIVKYNNKIINIILKNKPYYYFVKYMHLLNKNLIYLRCENLNSEIIKIITELILIINKISKIYAYYCSDIVDEYVIFSFNMKNNKTIKIPNNIKTNIKYLLDSINYCYILNNNVSRLLYEFINM